MDEIVAGEWCRTIDGLILKPWKVEDNYIWCGNQKISKEKVKKHNSEIKYLLETDDIIQRGEYHTPEVITLMFSMQTDMRDINIEINDEEWNLHEDIQDDDRFQIYSILTHEQFERNNFIVGK